jgi:hypothetical protein
MADVQRVEDSEKALQKAISDANEVLAEATTVFSLQRTQLVLNRAKLVIEKRSPLGARDVASVRVEDVLNVAATVGTIFGTVKITTKFTAPGAPLTIGLFWRKDAIRLKRIIQGYIIALQEKIDLDILPVDELRTLLYELGTDDHSVK